MFDSRQQLTPFSQLSHKQLSRCISTWEPQSQVLRVKSQREMRHPDLKLLILFPDQWEPVGGALPELWNLSERWYLLYCEFSASISVWRISKRRSSSLCNHPHHWPNTCSLFDLQHTISTDVESIMRLVITSDLTGWQGNAIHMPASLQLWHLARTSPSVSLCSSQGESCLVSYCGCLMFCGLCWLLPSCCMAYRCSYKL